MTYIKCVKCNREYRPCAVQKCPDEAATRKDGRNVCMSCCQKCKHVVLVTGGQVCGRRKENAENKN